METKKLLSSRQAAELLGIGRGAINMRVQRGTLTPALRLPDGRYLIDYRDIAEEAEAVKRKSWGARAP